MPPCFCKVYGCAGKDIPRSTRGDHAKLDRQLERDRPQQLERPSSEPPAPARPTPRIQPWRHPLTPVGLHSPRPLSPSSNSHEEVDRPISSSLRSELSARQAAEARGRDYAAAMEAALESSGQLVDIGDLDEDGEEEPGALPDVHTSQPAVDARPSALPIRPLYPRIPCDPRFPGENDADPFLLSQSSRTGNRHGAVTASNTHPGVFIVYTLVSWLHTQWKVPFRACDVALKVIGHALRSFLPDFDTLMVTDAPQSRGFYNSLSSVMTNLGVEPDIEVLPVCPSCLEPHPTSHSTSLPCVRCGEAIFRHTKRLDRRRGPRDLPRPLLQFPHKPIETQLRDIVSIPGMEEMLEHWRELPRTSGELQDIFDGRICQELPAANGRAFFENPLPVAPGEAPELRIGLSAGMDWFSYLRSRISASHSSGPFTFNIINLPEHYKYRVMNLILYGVLPGPSEQDTDEVQRFVRIIVNELLRLWEDGFVVATRLYPEGRRVRVVLVCVICDKPAAHKMGGFGSHSHTFFCTRCWIQQKDKATPQAFQKGGFATRSHDEHVRMGQEYARCSTQAARDEYVRTHAARWCELARLPYFDIVRMVVVDPMHCLLLGLVKAHFYHIWIKLKVLRKTKELRRFHSILADLEIPAYLGRLPILMGEPAGGSLTADQWLIAATVVLPVAVPQIWDEYAEHDRDAEEIRLRRIGAFKELAQKKKEAQAAARREKEAAKAAAAANARKGKRKRVATSRSLYREEPDADEPAFLDDGAVEEEQDLYPSGDDEDGNENGHSARAPPNLHPDDPSNIFKLVRFLELVLAKRITVAQVQEADGLIRAYCTELLHLYGEDAIRPNHHYATDVPDCILDYGPMHNFWTFLFERINKILKSYNTSNHAGGEIETTFFREFHRTIQQSRVMATSYTHGDQAIKASIDDMYHASADDRGTVQALARELDDASTDSGISYQLSSRSEKRDLSRQLYADVLDRLRLRYPETPLRSYLVPGLEVALLPTVTFFDYVIIASRRFWASSRTNNRTNSLLVVRTGLDSHRVGVLLDIIGIAQHRLPVQRLGHVQWLVPCEDVVPPRSAWMSTSSLRLSRWELNMYAATTDLIQLDDILAHVVLTEALVMGTRSWVTVTLSR